VLALGRLLQLLALLGVDGADGGARSAADQRADDGAFTGVTAAAAGERPDPRAHAGARQRTGAGVTSRRECQGQRGQSPPGNLSCAIHNSSDRFAVETAD
jgi:hypothetical protein